jgi:hypothetical protein
MSMLSTALAYAARGLRVFPLRPRDKRPANANGCTGATTEPDQLRALWHDHACNIGIAAGVDSGVLVLDIDGPDGRRTLTAWQAVFGALPPTPTVETASGLHMYFRHPGEQCPIRNSARKAGDGIDVRTDGGYVVAPPSVHPDGPVYAWAAGRSIDDLAFAEAPEWLLAKLVDKPREPLPTYEPNARSDYGHTRYGQRALDEECMELARAPEGGRNARLNQVAFRVGQLIASRHLVEGPAVADLYRAAKACGLEERETRATIASGLKGGMDKPNPSDPNPDEKRERKSDTRALRAPQPSEAEEQADEQESATREEMPAHQVAEIALEYFVDTERHKLPRSGFSRLDNAIGGIPPGALFTIGGRTGAGKSSLMLSMALKQIAQALPVGIVSCEDPDHTWGGRLLAAWADVDTRKFLNAMPSEYDVGRCVRAIREAKDKGLTLSFQIGKPISRIVSAVKRMVEYDGAKVIYVDYLQAISVKGQDRYAARTDTAQELKGLCYDLRVPLVLGSQLKRPENGNPFREPNYSDLKDSGDIENMSEVILLLWPRSDEKGAPVLGKVAKVKWSDERPRFQLLRSATNGTIIDLIDAPKEQRQQQAGGF